MDDAETVVQSSTGDQQIWNRRSVPHSMMVSKVSLKIECSLKKLRGSGNNLEACVQFGLQRVVVVSRTCRIQLLQLSDGTKK